MGDGDLTLPSSTFDALFPFHALVAPDGVVKRVGPALVSAAPSVRVGAKVSELFTLGDEGVPATHAALLKAVGRALFLTTTVGAIALRGEVTSLGEDALFVGSPWPLDGEHVVGLPVDGSLYAAHDATGELGELLMMQNFALEEAHGLAARLETQRHELARQNRELERKHQTILRLSAPTLRLWDDVLAVPIVGALDTDRVEAIMRAIAEHLTQQAGRTVIVDLTGADAVDTTTVRALASLSSVAKMLGARFMLTGIQPEIGQTIVELGLDMSSFVSFVNVSDALRAVLAEASKQRATARSPRARLARARELAGRVLSDDSVE